MSKAGRIAAVLLGLLTVAQFGTAVWRISIMFSEAARAGRLPVILNRGLLEEILLNLLLGVIAWLWLRPGDRTLARWAIHFLAFAWLLSLVHLCLGLLGILDHGYTWIMLAVLTLVAPLARRGEAPILPPPEPTARFHPALLAAMVFWLLQAPHLVFPYFWTDARDVWACRAFAFDLRQSLQGVFDCVDPSRPPLHSLLLWMGNTDPTFQGRLLPFLMVGALGAVAYAELRRIAPRMAPWGLLWLYMTVRVYQGAVTSYADVPGMVAISVAILAAARPGLSGSPWRGALIAFIAGAAATLIKRDGIVMLAIATGVLIWYARPRLQPRLVAGLAGALVGLGLWLFRPAPLFVPDQYTPQVQAPVPSPTLVPVAWPPQEPDAVSDSAGVTPQTFITMLYGMQGQVLSHYGYGMFVPTWIILAIWVWRRRRRTDPDARVWGRVAVLGWLGIVGLYVFNVLTGHVQRADLYVIRTAFGRHLVHMFVFCVLHATALAAVLLAPEPEKET